MSYAAMIWHNGRIRPFAEATVHVSAHALHYGSSVFEGERVYATPRGPCYFRLDDHTRRLFESARLYDIDVGYGEDEINTACRDLILANDLESAYVRPIVFRGAGGLGVLPDAGSPVDVSIMALRWGAYHGDALTNGADVCVSSWNRLAPNTMPALAKAGAARAKTADGVILGPVSHNDYPPVAQGGLNPSGELRKRLDLYANIRPARSRAGFPPRCGKPVDLVIARENTEGFYADRSMHVGIGEMMPTPDLAISLRKVTREGSTRIAESAFRLAARRPRKLVTAVHKANVLRISDGFFLDCVRTVAARYPDVRYEERIMDAMAALT